MTKKAPRDGGACAIVPSSWHIELRQNRVVVTVPRGTTEHDAAVRAAREDHRMNLEWYCPRCRRTSPTSRPVWYGCCFMNATVRAERS